MSLPPSFSTNVTRQSLLRFAETLAIAVVGGMAFDLAGFPAGWLSGSMLFVAAAAIAGRPVGVPAAFVRVTFIVIGMSLGAAATPESLRGLSTWPVSILVLIVAMVAVTVATASYLRAVHRWDGVSAFLAAAPGVLSQAVILATHYKADVRGVAIVQTVRVVILAVAVPAAIALFGLASEPPLPPPVAADNPALELAMLVGISAAAALILEALRFRAGLMFGSMLASAALHGAGLVHVTLPWWVAAGAMCVLGAITGSRFANTGARMLLNYIAAACGSFLVSVSVAAAFAFALVAISTFRTADVIVSFSPGALDVMMILALALHLDPIYVGAHHLARFALISVSLPLAMRVVRPRGDADAPR